MTTGTETQLFDLSTPTLSDSDFDRAYKAELKAMGGDSSDAKAVAKEIFSPQPQPAATQTTTTVPVLNTTTATETTEQQEVAETVAEVQDPLTESVTETTASATEGDSTSTTTTQATASEAAEWLSGLDPKVRAEVDKLLAEKKQLEHQRSSDAGRVAAFQRHYETARAEAEQLRKANTNQPQGKQPATTAAVTPSQTGTTNAAKTIPKEIQDILDVDETLGKVLLKQHEEAERREEALRNELKQLQETALNPLQEQYQTLHMERELDLLERELPGSLEVLRHPIWEQFTNAAPPWLQKLINSPRRDELSTALKEYQSWVNRPDVQQWAERTYGAPATNQQPVATATHSAQAVTVDPQKVAQAQKVKAEAERKASSQPVGTTAVGRPATAKLTMEQIMADPELLTKWHNQEFENNLAKVEGRKPRQL